MEKIMTIQGRETTYEDIKLVQRLIQDKPSWHRTRLSQELCLLWNWRAADGQVKDMACYQAANWIYVGQTKGRSRNDRYATLKVPIKDIYLYPLTKRFRETLTHEA